MPRISVIVPAFKVQAYLHACLDSVLSQSFTDFELNAVDDCSPDACGEIIDEYAAADPRVTAIHLEENVGLGRARNAGLRRARGDYLLFLDADDTLTPGALQAIADRLAAVGEPDILVFDYARTHWDGRTIRNVRSTLLAEEGPATFRLADRPSLLRLLMVAWNKVYRRDFVARHELSFPPGYYEDIPWTLPALLSADTIAVLDRVCVHYRQRRRGAITHSPGQRHFEIFEQYERVFSFADRRPELARWRPALYERMSDHFTAVLTAPDRLPRSARPAFFRHARTLCRRYRATRGTSVERRRAARVYYFSLVLGSHAAFRLLWAANRGRRRIQSGLRSARALLRKAVLAAYYALQRRRPLDENLAVFAAYWNRGYSCNPAAIEAKLRELAPHIRTAWVTTPEYAHTLPPGVRRLHPGSPAYWTALARARYLVNNVNFPARYVKRPGQTHLQTHHGTPLKHMGLDMMPYPACADRMDFARLMRCVDRWDYSLSANRHSTLAWERAYPADYTTIELGYPRNDILLTATAADVARVREQLGVPEGATALLYAPTHRDYRRGWASHLDPGRLLDELGPGTVLMVRAHYFYGTTGLPEDSRILDVSAHPSVEEVCLASDALITDYTSLMFDYANLDRPIIIYADDWEAYRAARGTYFDLTAFPPGAVARSEDELIDILATGAWRAPHTERLRAAFHERFCPYDDGRAAERVVRHVFLGEDLTALPPVTPLSQRRPAPGRAEDPARATGVRTAP